MHWESYELTKRQTEYYSKHLANQKDKRDEMKDKIILKVRCYKQNVLSQYVKYKILLTSNDIGHDQKSSS